MQQILKFTRALGQRSEHQSAIGDTLATRCRHFHMFLAQRSIHTEIDLDFDSFREHLGDKCIANNRRFLFVGGANAGEDDNLFVRTRVLLVDAHDIEEPVDAEAAGTRTPAYSLICQAYRQPISSQTPHKPPYGHLLQYAHPPSNLGLEDHADTNALSVEHLRGENSFDGVPDSVSEVDEVAESRLALVDGNDVGLDVDTASDDGEQQGLGDRARADVTARVARGGGTDSIVD